VAKNHENPKREEEYLPPKIAPGRKLPKPAVPHLYGKTGIGGYVSFEERMPPER
jgi:hypothetical protein